MSATPTFAQPQKNILRIWFDTITVKTLPAQVVMNCWFKIEGTKPHDFRGFQMPFIYEAHQITPYGYYFSGTASEYAGFHVGNHNSQTGTGSVVVLGSSELDLKKSLLFSIAYIALPRLNDTVFNDYIGYMEVDRKRFELSIDSGIDSVIIADGWIKYDKVIKPQPEKRASITLSSDSLMMEDDSSAWLSIRTSLLDSARIKHSVLSFSVDTSIVVFDTAVVGSAFGQTATLTIENKITSVNVYLTSIDDEKALLGSGELLKMKFTARKRQDTVATYLADSAYFALNTDNLLDTVRYELSPVIVYGSKDTLKSVRSDLTSDSHFTIVPNPANNFLTISGSMQETRLEIFSLLGEKVFESSFGGSITFQTQAWASGWYQVLLTRGKERERSLLLIQH